MAGYEFYSHQQNAPVAQLDRVSVSEAEGRRFESSRARQNFIASVSARDKSSSVPTLCQVPAIFLASHLTGSHPLMQDISQPKWDARIDQQNNPDEKHPDGISPAFSPTAGMTRSPCNEKSPADERVDYSSSTRCAAVIGLLTSDTQGDNLSVHQHSSPKMAHDPASAKHSQYRHPFPAIQFHVTKKS